MAELAKSMESIERTYIRFVNKTSRPADILWVNFKGSPIPYHTLEPGAYIDVDTFVNHPWIFEDHNTKDKLAVKNELNFFPPSFKEIFLNRFKNPPKNLPPHRIIVPITLPLYSLKERSLQVVRDNCPNLRENPEILQNLEELLPKSVFDDLTIKFCQKYGVSID